MNATIWGRWVSRLFQQHRRPQQPRSARRCLAFEPLEDRVTPRRSSGTGWAATTTGARGELAGRDRAHHLANPDLVFNSVTPRLNTTNDISNLGVKSITISASNYSLSGSNILLNGNVTVGPGAPTSGSPSTCS